MAVRVHPATRKAADALPSLDGERLLAVCHLDVKMVPYFEALTHRGAEVWACAANPATTRDRVAEHLELWASGPRRDPATSRNATPPTRAAIDAGPTLLSEMGADATAATQGRLLACAAASRRPGPDCSALWSRPRLPGLRLGQDPIKQGLHNRHLVGLMAANTFLGVTGS